MVLNFKDEVLCDSLNKVLSGLLPHDKYEASTFGKLYPTILIALPEQETRGSYYIFYNIFDKYFSLQNAMNKIDYQINLTREKFEQALMHNLPDYVLDSKTQAKQVLEDEGLVADLNIPDLQNKAMQLLYKKSMDLYDTCFELESSYEESLSAIVDLRDTIKANIIETGLQIQRTIMSVGFKDGRKIYTGSSGWVEFSQQMVREVSEWDLRMSGDLVCEGLDILPNIERDAIEISEKLGEYGIPSLDDSTPILKHRLVVFVARENTGKTKVTINMIASLIRSGVKSYYACGESKPQAIFMQIVSSYIFQEYGMYFTSEDLIGEGFNALSAEDKQIVQTAKARVACSGIIISDTLEYDNVLAAFTEAYNKGCEAFFVDHTQSLRGRRGRKIGELVTTLALDCREFKNTYPVYVCLLSQPSTNLKDTLQKEQTKDLHQSPTAQSSTPSQEADELFILTENDYLKKQNLLMWIVFKRRNAPIPPTIYIKKLFHVSSYEYDPNAQGGGNPDVAEMEEIISNLNPDDYDEEDGLELGGF